ncbi:MAG: SpoIIE family protein phosphatase, partial [Desulfosarcina sp.]|nr:SpoIIE family protein phosphatase [Desulfobacterales bacterium]
RSLLDDFSTTDRFMTLFALQVDRRKRKLQWIRAGHDPALIGKPCLFASAGPILARGNVDSYRRGLPPKARSLRSTV